MTKEELKDKIKNKISMALKDPVLQQGFECICKENTDLKAYNEKLLNSDIEKHNKIVELEAQIEKMKCCQNCIHFDCLEPNYCNKGVFREKLYVCKKWTFGN